jgi:hypothetical protein
MEPKTRSRTPDVSVRASFAIFQGALLAMSYPLIYTIAPDTVRAAPALVLLAVIPLLSFCTSSFINWFLQYMYCGSASPSKILTAASVSPLSVVILTGLSYLMPFLRSPVTQLVPEVPQDGPEDAVFAREIWGYSFYLFWGGVYGQTFGSGMISVCP